MVMAKEFDVKLRVCPNCREERSSPLPFCPCCGTEIKTIDVIVCMEEGKVERLLIKGQS